MEKWQWTELFIVLLCIITTGLLMYAAKQPPIIFKKRVLENCLSCKGSEWVCEGHLDKPMDECDCKAPGMPCLKCISNDLPLQWRLRNALQSIYKLTITKEEADIILRDYLRIVPSETNNEKK